MSIPMRCPNGHAFMARGIYVGNATDTTFVDYSEKCPACGAWATSISGTYSHQGGQITQVKNVRAKDREILLAILEALNSPSVTAKNKESLRSVANAVKRGDLNEKEAEEALSKFGPAFAQLLLLARQHGVAINAIMFLINIAISLYAIYDSGVTGDQAHSDAQEIQRTLADQNKILERLSDALNEQRKADEQKTKTKPPKAKKKHKRTPLTRAPNRHERRKASALSKRDH